MCIMVVCMPPVNIKHLDQSSKDELEKKEHLSSYVQPVANATMTLINSWGTDGF